MLRRGQDGFTLVEMLVVIVIIGVITIPLSRVLISYLHNSDATTARLTESHDAQIAAAYFSQDVASMGARDWADSTTPYKLVQSVELNAPETGGIYPCGADGSLKAVVRLGWDEFASEASAAATQMRAAYVVEPVASGRNELHRLICAGSATVASDLVLAHDLVSATVTCSSNCAGTGANVPQSINLTLNIHDLHSDAGSNYIIVLTGQRRQT